MGYSAEEELDDWRGRIEAVLDKIEENTRQSSANKFPTTITKKWGVLFARFVAQTYNEGAQ